MNLPSSHVLDRLPGRLLRRNQSSSHRSPVASLPVPRDQPSSAAATASIVSPDKSQQPLSGTPADGAGPPTAHHGIELSSWETGTPQQETGDSKREVLATPRSEATSIPVLDGQQRAESEGEKPKKPIGRRLYSGLKRQLAFIGPGIVASICFIDPGNWSTDTDAGAKFGYALLFIVLLSGLFSIVLQTLAARLGIVTGKDWAQNTRAWLLPEEQASRAEGEDMPRFGWFKTRMAVLWVLYLVAEGSMIATELAELVGSAIALNLLFPGLPLWGGVLITSLDVLLVLLFYRPQGSLRMFEVALGSLVFVVLGCFIVLVVRVSPNWPTVFRGYVPSSTLVQSDALYIGIGILGATVMPHAIVIGSHFSTADRLGSDCVMRAAGSDEEEEEEGSHVARDASTSTDDGTTRDAEANHRKGLLGKVLAYMADRFPAIDQSAFFRRARTARSPAASRTLSARIPSLEDAWPEKHHLSLKAIRQHLLHATIDIGLSLLFFAVTINSAILIVAAAAFYYGIPGHPPHQGDVGDLYEAHNLLAEVLGRPYAVLFAIALLASGQSASITCTLAGQIVSEGMIKWRVSPFMRRLLTRLITMIPGLAVSASVGRAGLGEMLIASQVTLSMALPFILLPLIVVTSMRKKMSVTEIKERPVPLSATSNDTVSSADQQSAVLGTPSDAANPGSSAALLSRVNGLTAQSVTRPTITQQLSETVCFANAWWLVVLAWAIWLAITCADVYVLATSF